MTRRGDWIQTYSGRAFWPLDPRAEDVELADIAHSLAHQCRFAGHCLKFYSVAEHSVILSRFVSKRAALAALLHDAGEAYLVDLPRPIKRAIPQYRAAEDAVFAAIAERFQLDGIPDEVHEADRRILTDEMRANMAAPPAPWSTAAEPLGIRLHYWSPMEARRAFIARFNELAEGGAR